MLDPSAQTTLDQAAAAGAPRLETLTPTDARAQFNAFVLQSQAPKEEIAEVWDSHAHGLLGPIPLRLYRPESAPKEGAPCLVYYHGGGWVIGDLESHDNVCRRIASLGHAVVVSVDYRMGPEHPFPAAIEDATAALRHVVAHADALGVDPSRIAVGGDSAGGNIAAVVAIAARDGDAPPVAYQILFYPVTDLSQTQASYYKHAEGYGLTTPVMAWFRAHYLTHLDQAKDWRASPLLAHSLVDVAPAFVLTAGYDPLHDEGRDYADRLRADGVPTILDENPGQIHGFVSMDGAIPEGRAAVGRAVAAWAGARVTTTD